MSQIELSTDTATATGDSHDTTKSISDPIQSPMSESPIPVSPQESNGFNSNRLGELLRKRNSFRKRTEKVRISGWQWGHQSVESTTRNIDRNNLSRRLEFNHLQVLNSHRNTHQSSMNLPLPSPLDTTRTRTQSSSSLHENPIVKQKENLLAKALPPIEMHTKKERISLTARANRIRHQQEKWQTGSSKNQGMKPTLVKSDSEAWRELNRLYLKHSAQKDLDSFDDCRESDDNIICGSSCLNDLDSIDLLTASSTNEECDYECNSLSFMSFENDQLSFISTPEQNEKKSSQVPSYKDQMHISMDAQSESVAISEPHKFSNNELHVADECELDNYLVQLGALTKGKVVRSSSVLHQHSSDHAASKSSSQHSGLELNIDGEESYETHSELSSLSCGGYSSMISFDYKSISSKRIILCLMVWILLFVMGFLYFQKAQPFVSMSLIWQDPKYQEEGRLIVLLERSRTFILRAFLILKEKFSNQYQTQLYVFGLSFKKWNTHICDWTIDNFGRVQDYFQLESAFHLYMSLLSSISVLQKKGTSKSTSLKRCPVSFQSKIRRAKICPVFKTGEYHPNYEAKSYSSFDSMEEFNELNTTNPEDETMKGAMSDIKQGIVLDISQEVCQLTINDIFESMISTSEITNNTISEVDISQKVCQLTVNDIFESMISTSELTNSHTISEADKVKVTNSTISDFWKAKIGPFLPKGRAHHEGFIEGSELTFFQTELIGGSHLLKESNPCFLSGLNSYLQFPGKPSNLFCAHLNKLIEEEWQSKDDSPLGYLHEEEEADFLEIPMFDIASDFVKKMVQRRKNKNQMNELLQLTHTGSNQSEYEELN
jgi:hypothetical protein